MFVNSIEMGIWSVVWHRGGSMGSLTLLNIIDGLELNASQSVSQHAFLPAKANSIYNSSTCQLNNFRLEEESDWN